VPSAIAAMRVGKGSKVSATTTGTLPFLFLNRFNASVRVFCARSLPDRPLTRKAGVKYGGVVHCFAKGRQVGNGLGNVQETAVFVYFFVAYDLLAMVMPGVMKYSPPSVDRSSGCSFNTRSSSLAEPNVLLVMLAYSIVGQACSAGGSPTVAQASRYRAKEDPAASGKRLDARGTGGPSPREQDSLETVGGTPALRPMDS